MCSWSRQAIIQDIVLAIVINTSAALLSGAALAWGSWYPFTCAALGTNLLAQLVIPTGSIARAVTAPLGTVAWRVYAQIFVENLVFVTIISLAMAFTQVGATGMLDAWRATYLWLVLIGYVTSVCLYLVFHPREA